MMLRPQTLIAGLTPGATPRNQFGAKAVQICTAGGMTWAKNPYFLRNAPHTIEHPTIKQLAIRIRLGNLAKEARVAGKTKIFYNGLPGAAGYVQEHKDEFERVVSGLPSQRTARKSYHTLEQLKEMYERKKKELEAKAAPATF